MKSFKVKNISLLIDGNQIEVPDDFNVLEAIQKAGLYIPRLCYLENLNPYGGCRLCIVDIEKLPGFPTACTTPVSQGMKIKTKTPKLQKLRKEIFKLILSEHPYSCLVCKENHECPEYMHSTRKVSVATGCNFCTSNGDCELQDLVDYLEIKDVDYPIKYRGVPVIRDNPFYEIDYNLCILCGRCVRICNEERNSGVLAFVQRGNSTLVGTAFDESQKDAGCEFCGACVDVCPTGSLSEKIGRWVSQPDKSTKTTCLFCGEGCTMNINSRGNRIINVGPEPGGRTNPLQLCLRGKFIPGDAVHHPDRIKTPMIRKNGKWIEVTWDEAISYTASNLERYRGNQFGIIGSGMIPMEENYILQKFARKVMRSNNNDLFHSYRFRELPTVIHNHYLSKPPTEIKQITEMDALLLIGTDGSVSHPMVENRIRKAYRNGTSIVFANTESNRTAQFATIQLKYKAGLLGILLDLLKDGVKQPFGSDSVKGSGKNSKPNSRIKKTGISEADLESAIKAMKSSDKVMIIVGDQLLHGPDCKQAFQTLIDIEKELEKDGSASLLVLMEEGNRYGSIFSGMHPDLLPGFNNLFDTKIREEWSTNWGVVLSEIRGMSWQEMMSNIRDDGITSLFVTGDIPMHPDIENLKFLVQQNLFMTEISNHAHVILPAMVFPEMSGHILTQDRKLKEVVQVIETEEGFYTMPQVIAAISRQMQETGFEYSNNEEIFKEIQTFTDLSFSEPGREGYVTSGTEEKIPVVDDDLLVLDGSERAKYRLMGNPIASFVPDLKEIRDD